MATLMLNERKGCPLGREANLAIYTYITSEQLSGFSNHITFVRRLTRSALEMEG